MTSVDGNVTQRNGPAGLQNAFAFVFVIASSSNSSSSSRLASFDRSMMTDAEVIWISSDDESDCETVCAEIEHYYSLEANDDLVDASMDIRYDLEWASGAWLDYTWNQELMELFGEFDDGNWVDEIDSNYFEEAEMEAMWNQQQRELDADDGDDSDDVEYDVMSDNSSIFSDWEGLPRDEVYKITSAPAVMSLLIY